MQEYVSSHDSLISSERVYIGNRYLYSYSDKCHAINEIIKASKDIRDFSIEGVTFLSYEKLIDEATDFKRLINDAQTALQKAEATMKHLLEGGSLEEEEKGEDWVSVPIFYLNNENVSYLRTIIHYTNIISPFSGKVLSQMWKKKLNQEH